MNVIIVQPPVVQLNTVYPSGAFLSGFFKRQGHSATWFDMNIRLMERIFSRTGLEKIFASTENRALKMAEKARRSKDFDTAENLERYVLQKDLWCSSIDMIMSVLRGDTEQAHRLAFSPHTPRGLRMERYMAGCREFGADNARMLATYALADLADYISYVADPNFSLVRYAESIAISESSFSQIEKSIDSPVLTDFYAPLLQEIFGPDTETAAGIEKQYAEGKKTLVCISVPFAGTFTPALFSARFFRKTYGPKVFVSIGGGFINTELRDVTDTAIAEYADALSYDRGYGSYRALFESGLLDAEAGEQSEPLYKLRIFRGQKVLPQLESHEELEEFENLETSLVIPDYSDIDFSRYPCAADSTNPMQRLWSDGAWLKAYLAHGCYWHRCSFCDVTLDYVKAYRMTQVSRLFDGLYAQCRAHNVYGIHFVDEAMPPQAMKTFAEKNMAAGSPLSFWGNVRFEKVYTRDLADFLAKGGLIGVSGGIEIATGSGLDRISKGTDLDSIVSACCAFKEAGILVHAYMIYGYFGESDQDIINSMETLRQLFEAGLIDSCFWHKFVLTRHSRLYDEWKKGMHPDLKPIEPAESGVFAKNGLHFEGEEKSEKFGDGLNLALESWMNGRGIKKPVGEWFDFKVPKPGVPQNLVEKSLARYEQNRDRACAAEAVPEKLWWLGGSAVVSGGFFQWNYMQENCRARIPSGMNETQKNQFVLALNSLSPQNEHRNPGLFADTVAELEKSGIKIRPLIQEMRAQGLCKP